MPEAVVILMVIFGGFACVIGIIAFAIVSVVNGGRRDRLSAEESQLMQELFQGFTRMENRIETLETLLLEKERGGKQP